MGTERLQPLLDQLSDLRARNKALEIRVQFLTERLEQRFKLTVQSYDSKAFDNMRDMVMKVFLESDPSAMMSMPEVIEAFDSMFPAVNSAFVPRRVYELSEPSGKFGSKLGRKQDPDGTVRYFLMLVPEAQL